MDGRLSQKTRVMVGMITINVLFDCWGEPVNMEHQGGGGGGDNILVKIVNICSLVPHGEKNGGCFI